jgi:peptide/nickel transport system substrate-binding protein
MSALYRAEFGGGSADAARWDGLTRRGFLTGAAGLSAGLAAGCGATRQTVASRHSVPRPRYGGDLKVGLTGGGSTDTLDPHQGLSYPGGARGQSLYNPLVQLSRDAEVEYVLATEMIPRDKTATEWVIKLRPGVTFHNGKDFTADDVVFTFQRIIENNYSANHVLGPVNAAGIRALDRLTVLMPMNRPYATLPEQLASIITAQIVPEGFSPANPVGTGPFVYKSFTAGTQSLFTRNPHYRPPS